LIIETFFVEMGSKKYEWLPEPQKKNQKKSQKQNSKKNSKK